MHRSEAEGRFGVAEPKARKRLRESHNHRSFFKTAQRFVNVRQLRKNG